MAYIYEIVNDVNQKRYIGKTEFDINKRLKEHFKDAFKERNKDRPLYRAMRKYGIEHFLIHLIEETDYPEEREMYWIAEKDTYHNGYNATHGGDGKKYLDYDLIIKTYNDVLSLKETAQICGVCVKSVRKILRANNIKIVSAAEVVNRKLRHTIGMYNVDDHLNAIHIFESYEEATSYLNQINNTRLSTNAVRTHIGEVCRGKRNTAYGYYWEFLS